MQQTPQPRDKEDIPSEVNATACAPTHPAEQDEHAEKHIFPSEEEIDISDEDRALDSGI